MCDKYLAKMFLRFALIVVCSAIQVSAASFAPENVLITERGPTGPAVLLEYTRSGQLIQQVYIMPPPGVPLSNIGTKDVATDQAGNAYVMLENLGEGTNPNRFVAKYAAASANWSYYTTTNFMYGGGYGWEGSVDVFGNYLYCQSINHNSIRFNINNATAVSLPNDSLAMSMGLDGKLYDYAVQEAGSFIRVYDPVTLALQKTIDLKGLGMAALAINTKGDIFTGGGSYIRKLNEDGTVAQSLFLGDIPQLYDLDISSDGTLLATTRFGKIVLVNESLSASSIYSFDLPPNQRWETFGSFVNAVPEPAVMTLLGVGTIGVLVWVWPRKRR